MSNDSADSVGQKTPDDGVEAQTAWKTLDWFRVKCQGREFVDAPIYANGYQQMPISIEIRALDANGNVVTLSQSQLDGIKLIDFYDESSLPTAQYNPVFEYGWTVGREQGDGDAAATEAAPAGVQTVMRYLIAARSTNIKASAMVISPDGSTFKTNHTTTGPGHFDSWIQAIMVPEVVHTVDSFKIEREDELDSMWVDIDMYYIGFKDESLRIVRDLSNSHELNKPHYRWEKGGWRSKVHIAFAVGEKRSFRYPSNPPSGEEHLAPWFTVNKYSGKASVARISCWIYPNPSIAEHLEAFYWDQNGNRGKIMIRHSSDGNTIGLGPA
ncbi:hypothetical protein [Stenotrophomonas oahuensis]|uniref:Uncharacterized protein n=1 Tax=Stenotrophomonas oahuensis TaxID=3003271 RepID=A0ABY9YQ99_9GAMM|nr:hypothetical protein [Stenotrophomonas sp. A5586]WNH52394.1 hypothetical protein PDM29_19010 [Stenotrophomonas sp. A5586]